MYRWVAGIGAAMLVVLAVVLVWPRAPLDSALTSPGAPPTRLTCYGYIDTPQGPMLLQPARAGQVTHVFVQEKQTVSKDMPLVQLDDRLIMLQVTEAELAVNAAQLQLAKAENGLKQYEAKLAQVEAALEAARIKYSTAQHYVAISEQMAKDGLNSKGRVDLVRDERDVANVLIKAEQNKLAELKAMDPMLEVKLAQLQLNRSQTQMDLARQERELCVLRAPVDGRILRVQVQPGDLSGPTSPRPVVWLAPSGPYIVRAEVAQEFAGRVQEGLAVQVEDEASARVLARGRIVGVSDWFLPRRQCSTLPTGINTGVTLECVIDLEKGFAHLRLGQRVRVRVLAAQPTATQDNGKAKTT
jgi:multidrug resistance efflux pump